MDDKIKKYLLIGSNFFIFLISIILLILLYLKYSKEPEIDVNSPIPENQLYASNNKIYKEARVYALVAAGLMFLGLIMMVFLPHNDKLEISLIPAGVLLLSIIAILVLYGSGDHPPRSSNSAELEYFKTRKIYIIVLMVLSILSLLYNSFYYISAIKEIRNNKM